MFVVLPYFLLPVITGEQFWVNDNKKELSGKSLKTIERVSLVQCTLKCQHYTNCQFIGFYRDEHRCVFYQNQDGGSKIEKQGQILYVILKKTLLHHETSTATKDKDCLSLFRKGFVTSGVYSLSDSVKIYCDQTTDGGGWTVFQRHQDPTSDFYLGWEDYKNGFGNLNSDFWMGNDLLHCIAGSKSALNSSTLRIDMTFADNQKYFAKYSSFSIGDEQNNYKIIVDVFIGNTLDGMSHHNGLKFSTYDRVNQGNQGNCALAHKGAWWYKGECYKANLNGKFDANFYWQGNKVISSEMKMRRN